MSMRSMSQRCPEDEVERIRFMRLIVMYDLPIDGASDRRDYARFRQFLIRDGYVRLQNSVYVRMVVDSGNANAAISRLSANLPADGLVQVLRVTESTFCSMLTLSGEPVDEGHLLTREDFIVL